MVESKMAKLKMTAIIQDCQTAITAKLDENEWVWVKLN